MVKGQGIGADDVHIGLDELAEAAILGALTAPHLLDLVSLEREVQLARVLQHVSRQRDGEIEVQSELGVLGIASLEAVEQIDLLGGFPLAQKLIEWFDGTRLDSREPVQLERLAQGVQNALLDDSAVGQPLGETGKGGNLHRGHSSTTGPASSS